MSQHNGLPGPPPTPGSAGSVPGDFYSQRRRAVPAQPPALTTNFLRAQGSPLSQTPITAVSTAGTGTPFPYRPSTPRALNPRTSGGLNPGSPAIPTRSPNPAMEPYNPRQWNQRQMSGSQMVFGRASNASGSTREATGMEEAMPSPPPPYSPETSSSVQHAVRGSPMLENAGFTASPLPTDSPARHSPSVPMSPAFPPPPPTQSSRHRERSTSGLAGPRAFLSGLRGKQSANFGSPVQTSSSVHVPLALDVVAPAARRAASTGHIQASGHPIHTIVPGPSERSSPENSWQPGMPLPGPPSAPPPPGTRSQSLNRYAPSSTRSSSLKSEDHFESQHQRRAAATSNLGPIPPTPADWVEDQDLQLPQTESLQPQAQPEPVLQPLRIDTGAHRDTSITRRPATRDVSAQGIRERRSRSRRAKERSGDDIMSPTSDDSRPSDLLFSPAASSISRRREHMRTVSGYANPAPMPRPDTHARSASHVPLAATSILTPPYTPAVGKEEAESSKKQGLKVPGSASSERPISHLLHTPNDDTSIPAPLSPARPPSASSAKTPTRLDHFLLQALGRHRAFIEKEAAATSDEERLELFANFMVHESRLRRDRYSAAYNMMAGDIVDLTRDMWRSYTKAGKRAVTPSTSMSSFDPTIPSWASDGQRSAHGGIPSSASSFGDFTPATDIGSVGDNAEIDRSESRQWAETFKPSLSPIQSVAQSTLQDEDSSRGRAPSRWWEDNSGSGSVGRPDRIEKSHRETKYMGIRASELQESDEPSPALSRHTTTPGASAQSFGGSSVCSSEKVGWQEGVDYDTPMATPAHAQERKASTPGLEPLDVSRLVTLPPPYPRHHPAVNNSHPRLAELRSEHRALADHRELQRIKDASLDGDFALQQAQKEATKERRARLRSSIQSKVSDGSISFAEAAQAEADFDAEEAERSKADARALFDIFEANVAQPLNNLLTQGIEKATAAIGQLRTELSFGNQASDPNQAQEEGDEQPERLEKLTLLKWLFESREQLHKEMFDLHAQRSEKYSEVILAPYRVQRSQAKIDEAAAFFTKDSNERQMKFAQDALQRYEELQRVMEKNVSRGVEDQLSAFWDIAPNLMEVITRLPSEPDMAGFEVLIPAQEYEENPGYHQFPLQYLYSLLSHAEKSAYQFIESQTNLLCLLHEVRTATSKSSIRLMAVQRTADSPNDPNLEAEILRARREAEDHLTEDLKEKVGQVEEQWQEALGDGLEECKERVKGWLEQSGGWEDGLDE
ncbi:hypothetical protein LTR85_009139 [Meristemomyces frigidus]|nr:hypothetical protein LTR85_009139 [Meristemomyces frigidus]